MASLSSRWALFLLFLTHTTVSHALLVSSAAPLRLLTRRLAMTCVRRRMSMSESGGEDGDGKVGLSLQQRKVKALELRNEAVELEASAATLRKEAVAKEQQAAKLRIEAWQLEGTVSAVTKEVTLTDKYEKQLAELDLMAEDWIDTDEEKWEWYQKQRQMIKDMIDAQKEYDQRADEQLQDLKEILLDLQDMFNIVTVQDDGNITAAGWTFVVLSVLIPVWIGYELFLLLSTSSTAFFELIDQGGKNDPFKGLQ
mmetsp:Transcript_29430/g.66641  ORF Transcript_29430/g.66641 Transcript_29430/m.66641 type:complete len:254 (-) Transcript_29430:44-805(-)